MENTLNKPVLILIRGVDTDKPSIYEATTAEYACHLLSSYVADYTYDVKEYDEGSFRIIRLTHQTQKSIRFGFYGTAEEAWENVLELMYEKADCCATASGDMFGTDKDALFEMANEFREERGLARFDFKKMLTL